MLFVSFLACALVVWQTPCITTQTESNDQATFTPTKLTPDEGVPVSP